MNPTGLMIKTFGIALFGIMCFLAYRGGLLRRGAVASRSGVPPAAQMATAVAAASTSAETKSGASDAPPSSSSSGATEPEDDASDGGTFVAIRYDKTHVLFRVAGQETDFELREDRTKTLNSLPKPVAEYGGDALWEPDAQLLAEHRKLFDHAPTGEQWQLEIAAGVRAPVVVQKPVVVMVGCFAFAGVLAEAGDPAFAASAKQYFLVHKSVSASTPGLNQKRTQIGELSDWKATPELRAQIGQLLRSRIKDEAAKVHDSLHDEYERMAKGGTGDVQQWKQFDARLIRGEGKLDFDMQAFQLALDATPRTFVRAKWTLGDKTVFLMSAWLRIQPELAVESVDSRESERLRMIEFQGAETDFGSLGTIVNVFDLRNNGHGELLIYNPGYEGYDIHLFRYTKSGPVTTSISHGGGC